MNTIDAIKKFKCKTGIYNRFNYGKGLIFVSEFEMENTRV